jgi:DAK2 domain fusion protein YloV
MLISGANNLFNYYPEVDTLNVFPVPDGDTGTNMNLTFSSGIKEIGNLHTHEIGAVAKSFSRGLLMGARGNSGVILSQIFKGIALQLEHKDSVGAVELAKAFVRGQKVAYKAVMKPVEGTILTVIREASDNTLAVIEHHHTIKDVFEKLVEFGNVSLENTPELLPVLKEVGVVDSGGFGLIKILEGMAAYLNNESIEKKDESDITINNFEGEVFIDNHEGEYGYCTEFLVQLENQDDFNEKDLRSYLEDLGNSIVVVNDDDIVKVHVHTLDPGKALSKAITLGSMLKVKIENMQEQADNNDNFKNIEPKEQAIIAVASGSGIEKMFKELRVDHIISGGQTMNPSTKDFIKAIKALNAKKIIILPNNSNIILAANQAKDELSELEIEVVPSKTIIQGMVACINYNPDLSFDDNVTRMNEALNEVKSGEVTFAIKNTIFGGRKINKNDYMGIFEKDVVSNGHDLLEITKDLIKEMVDDDSELVTLIYGDNVETKLLNDVVSYVEDTYDLEVESIAGMQSLYSFYVGVE